MNFKKIERTISPGYLFKSKHHVSFIIYEQRIWPYKYKRGRIHFNSLGMKYLKNNNIDLKGGDLVDLYYDSENGRIALKKSDKGCFSIINDQSKYIKIESSCLIQYISNNSDYMIEILDDNKYNLILNPAQKIFVGNI